VAGHTNKLADRSTPMVMIGYEAGTKTYRAYNPVNKKLVVTRDVLFEEEKSWNWSSAEPVQSISNEIFTVVYSDSYGDAMSGSTAASAGAGTRQGDPAYESRGILFGASSVRYGRTREGVRKWAGPILPCIIHFLSVGSESV
jgi:hypothetical protein